MIERISELPWASFEYQLVQKCKNYLFKDHRNLVEDADNYDYWKMYTREHDNQIVADEVYSIQQQILFNCVALNDELSYVSLGEPNPNDDRQTDKDIFFWNDLIQYTPGVFPHKGYDNTKEGRLSQYSDEYFHNDNNSSLSTPSYHDTEDEPLDNLTNLPKTHAARSLIEVSEYYGPNNPESKHSNYVSRKVSMLWFFNVIKAIAKAIRVFPWIRIGIKDVERTCRHPEAESEPNNPNSPHGPHTFRQSENPSKDGSFKVYGNAEFNGEVSTFHSQARFHDEVTMWDKLSVYGQSYFAKDINGTAMRVRWGDLAEYYSADADYAPGTLVRFGGLKEVTVANEKANAVVTSNPGLVLNEELKLKTNGPEHPVGLALVGRVPVKVWGGCAKFDLLVPDPEHPGWARVQAFSSEQPIARALENKMSEDLVLCATNFKI